MEYLLDTCIISYFFRKNTAVINKMQALNPSSIKISSITVMEIDYGLKANKNIAQHLKPLWENLLNNVGTLPFSFEDARIAANIRAQLKKKGQPIGAYDVLLAGCALNRKMTFVTANIKEFQRVNGLKVENWQ